MSGTARATHFKFSVHIQRVVPNKSASKPFGKSIHRRSQGVAKTLRALIHKAHVIFTLMHENSTLKKLSGMVYPTLVYVNTVNLFKTRFDKFWMHQGVKYNFTADPSRISDRSRPMQNMC